ncbi:TetR/AcrR family transcriptional regulator [[Mycobacterium] crassicus]|uniref:TetR/AcrR family transcriptional regulator n=1 Tax=[Mycobacterium] crassicus TaxID=2872309 RepID=A0ABU5XLT5_9MYCO|nr:TetR/AcrR family transcriptional regulator [Mycolicibacter sp. MYC098]MEB3022307.1 TetR/AcrR family transcriptional regulator [Mycolicibacter sp. MYC098]
MVLTGAEIDRTRDQALDAAEWLFYERGIHAVGMDDVRSASGLALRRLYRLFPSKMKLVCAYLERRNDRWLASLKSHVSAVDTGPRGQALAVFDWLQQWFEEPGFRGCAFINAFGESGATSPEIVGIVQHHKDEFRSYVTDLVIASGATASVGTQVVLLAEGAMVTAAISTSPEPANWAKAAAEVLLPR